MHRKLFFSTSSAVADRLTETFDFVWATATAHWNLRWQVDGFLRAHPSATDEDLKSRFALGSDIRGANLRRSCIESSWPSQQEMFARILLIEFCALYEAWIDGTLEALGHNSTHAKNLQFPSTAGRGVGAALSALQTNVSPELEHCLYPVLMTNRKNSLGRLENLLSCYRYFKECRNAIIHHGGLATQKTVDAYKSFAGETTASLGVAEVPQHAPVRSLGDSVSLSLRGVVGFGEIVLKLVTTLDAELAKTKEAEQILARSWNSLHGRNYNLPADPRAQETRLVKLVRKLGLETPRDPPKLLPMFRRLGLVATI